MRALRQDLRSNGRKEIGGFSAEVPVRLSEVPSESRPEFQFLPLLRREDFLIWRYYSRLLLLFTNDKIPYTSAAGLPRESGEITEFDYTRR
jgi:hypothetical protein